MLNLYWAVWTTSYHLRDVMLCLLTFYLNCLGFMYHARFARFPIILNLCWFSMEHIDIFELHFRCEGSDGHRLTSLQYQCYNQGSQSQRSYQKWVNDFIHMLLWFPNRPHLHQFYDLDTTIDLYRITSGFHSTFAIDVFSIEVILQGHHFAVDQCLLNSKMIQMLYDFNYT